MRRKNQVNSNLGVTCVAPKECEFRHTSLCDKCENNKGMEKTENYFKSKE